MKIRDYFFTADRDVVLPDVCTVEHVEVSTDADTGLHKARDPLERQRRYDARNRDKKRAYLKDYRARNADKLKAACRRFHWKRWGVTPTRPMPELCEAGCGRAARYLDHCHTTKKFRGWLCSQCNTALGLLGDNLFGVRTNSTRLAAYLERSHEG